MIMISWALPVNCRQLHLQLEILAPLIIFQLLNKLSPPPCSKSAFVGSFVAALSRSHFGTQGHRGQCLVFEKNICSFPRGHRQQQMGEVMVQDGCMEVVR